MKSYFLLLFLTSAALSHALPTEELLLDLNAAKGLTLEEGGKVKLELFVNSPQPAATGKVPVEPASNPSKMTIGQERDAIEHPDRESFDGEIASSRLDKRHQSCWFSRATVI